MPKPKHTALSVHPDARDEFRHLVFELIGRAGRTVNMTQALKAVSIVGRRHVEEVIEELAKGDTK